MHKDAGQEPTPTVTGRGAGSKGVIMYKKLTFACTFISFLMVISCARNAWRNVTSVDEVLGEWEGIISVRLSENPDLPVLEIPVTLSISTDNNQNYIYEETADYG